MPSALTDPCVVCSRRAAASSWVSVSRAANCLGRSRGTLCISFVVQMPCRSGSPHVVRGAFHVDVVGLPCPASELEPTNELTNTKALNAPNATKDRLRIDPPPRLYAVDAPSVGRPQHDATNITP